MDTPIIFEQWVICVKFSVSSSFGGQWGQEGGRAGSEHYVQTQIFEPPCLVIQFDLIDNC